ncbi:MAG TPA: DUF3592 domain-containing protein [Verrucomicrobiales bacterium]|nr:DUF3592 domain-containing protein [Verrucomicrobiales bacterium]
MKNTSPSSSETKRPVPSQIPSRIWKSLMGLFLIGIGSIFVEYLWHSYLRAAAMDHWIETPCRIVSMTVDDKELNQRGLPKYVFEVVYAFDFNLLPYTGSRVKRLPTEVSDPRKLKEYIEDYAVGTETTCFVDPDAPERAVLKKDSKAALYTLWFPCLFIIGGAGMILTALFRRTA